MKGIALIMRNCKITKITNTKDKTRETKLDFFKKYYTFLVGVGMVSDEDEFLAYVKFNHSTISYLMHHLGIE